MKILYLLLFSLSSLVVNAESSYSVAGLFNMEKSGRIVYNFNPGWRFFKGDVKDAEHKNFDDSRWEVISTPHTVELMPAEASGCRNYQGIVWYRKRFVVPVATKDKDVSIHFEAVMGKQVVYLNGKRVKEHLGGYLPFNIDLSKNNILPGDTCVIAVMADNSDDKNYPPGKKQSMLDFAYHGGIYRDVWMIAKSKVAITDEIDANHVAGGGIFVHYDNISEKGADVYVNTEICNNDSRVTTIELFSTILDKGGKRVGKVINKITLKPEETKTVYQKIHVTNPNLWSPADPYLYKLETKITKGSISLDGGITKIGIRKAEFKGKDGFWLNGKPYGQIIGANRHQDFAYVGNALPNSQQWRDAKRLKDAGFEIVRVAHYPQDPSFMDACDELGLFVIVATPGWQYWNKDPEFAELVSLNTRQMIRRDRNHPCVLMWEPILNETRFPLDFSLKALEITKEEFPYTGCPIAAADMNSAGVKDNYDLVYGWPGDDYKDDKPKQCIFTREFGENVDDWYAHNNNNRASRSWGERPMKVQALSLAKSYDELFKTTGQYIGGALWHPFDHQRGYHSDPYWGGIFDAFRQPKYAYYMFKSQSKFNKEPMCYILNEMTPFSDGDVVVFSNCDSVRLSAYDGDKTWTLPVLHKKSGMPNAPVVFNDVWNFWKGREYSYLQKNWQKVNIVAEGIMNGKVVCTTKKMPSRRSTKIRLYIDELDKKLVADGSDFIVVVAEVTDDNGNVRRLAKDNIQFSVEGEGEIIGDSFINANPRAVEFGSAPVLIRSTRRAGKIKVTAHVQFEGIHAPSSAQIEFESTPYDLPFCFIDEKNNKAYNNINLQVKKTNKLTDTEKEIILKEVEEQQAEFGTQK